ncbi:Sensor protein ZraS [Legionella massiliensis]|uniref:histidine kinase n=1 Tax=Legionella massiliensis TaxID=1034943 RepID=A0A078L3A3_9GAMM|nr:ATP-binding protein [Legionella massiliensis]CDZ78599.1 Sensor protein ZraS [Legionella massiliensis]CEE14337.1 Sensor protein ZraS [Legionella massiliensis]
MQANTTKNKDTKLQEDLPLGDILSCLPCGLVVLNAQGQVHWLNSAAEQLLGAELEGQPWREIIQRAFAPREDDGLEVSLVDGRRVQVAISSLASLPGQLVVLTDMTATRAYERDRANKDRLVTIGRMTAQLAHQLRTPLSSAILYSDHLANLVFDDKRCEQWLARIQSCHASIEKQIQDLLRFARGEKVDPVLISIQDWCERLRERASPLVEADSAQLIIKNQISDKTEYSLYAESLTGAVLNLIINALQAQANCITLVIKQNKGCGLQLQISDNGVGMSDEVKSQAFAPFFTTKAQGTGLGMAVVYAVVKAHGGDVELDSIPGQGSCITINLP